MNTVEGRRTILVIVTGLILLHLFLSERIITRNSFTDPDLRQSSARLFDQYQLFLSGE